MSINKELAVLARELESIIAAVGKIRHRTLVILMWSLASAVAWKVIAPGLDLAPVAERLFLFITAAGFGGCSVLFIGLTIWRFKLTQQHERLLKNLATKGE
jgi:hypothetical protein